MLALYVSFPEPSWDAFAAVVGVDSSAPAGSGALVVPFDEPGDDLVRPFDVAIGRLHDSPTTLDLVQFWMSVIPAMFPPTTAALPAAIEAPSWLTRSLEAMHDEENLRLGLPRLLELAHVSRTYLAVTMRRHFDTTPTSLVMNLRLRRAATLLTTTEESIRAIAARCGFDNHTYFSTAFRRAYLFSPREYRWRLSGGAYRANA
jgi:AraC-like DNA-binding protein